jgi:hypothetical protein
MEKILKTKIVYKHEKEEDWKKSSYIPLATEFVVYDEDENYNYKRFKLGDGERSVNELPFEVGDFHPSMIDPSSMESLHSSVELKGYFI